MFETSLISKEILFIKSGLYFQPPTTITNSKKIATRNGHTNHNSDPYTDLGIEKDIGKEKDIDTDRDRDRNHDTNICRYI